MRLLPLFAALTALCSFAADAPLASPNAQGVAMGHLHIRTADVAAQKAFWIDILGCEPYKLATIEGAKMPGAVILFIAKAPTGPTLGSSINHIGVKVKDMEAAAAKLTAAKIAFERNPNGKQLMVAGPDGLRTELTEDKAIEGQIVHHHIHFYTPSPTDTQAWYAKYFGAVPGRRAIWDAGDLPGANLTFAKSETLLAPTAGRALDHIGFEVKNLAAFCDKLKAEGIKFDTPYTKRPELGIGLAFLTDPWGVRIELTEGL